MLKVFSNDYFTVVAQLREEAVEFFYKELLYQDDGEIQEIVEIDPNKKKMLFPINELPEEYHDQDKYPRKVWLDEYIGVEITLAEALKHCKIEEVPFILCVSSDAV